VNFVELSESSFLANESKYKPNELEWLNNSFNSLFDILVKYHSKGTKRMTIQNSVFNKYLESTFNKKSKLLFICCVSPAPRDIIKSRESLQFTSNLRSLILQKKEKLLIKIAQKEAEQIVSKSSLDNSESTPVSPTIVIDRKLKSIKNKITNASVLSVTGDDFDEWIRDREYELLKAENEISILPSNAERHSVKLQELSQLRAEIDNLKEKQKRVRTSVSNISASQEFARKSSASVPKKRASENILILRSDTSTSKIPTKGESPKQQVSVRSSQTKTSNRPKMIKSNNTPRQSKQSVRSRSQTLSPYHSFREASVESSRKTSTNKAQQSPSAQKAHSRHDTPKFEQKSRQSPSRSASQERSRNTKSFISEVSNYLTTAPQERDSQLSRSLAVKREGSKSPATPRTPKMNKRTFSPQSKTKKGYSSGEDSGRKSSRKSRSNSKVRGSSKKLGRSKSKTRDINDKVTELLEKCEELKSLKDRNFDFVDEEEEYFVRKKLNDCTRDKVINKYRELFYKSREMKELLNEIADNGYRMSSVTSKLKDQNDFLFEENTDLRKKLESIQGDISDQERHKEKTIKSLKEKVSSVEKERDFLNSKVAELQNEIQQLKPLATRGSDRVSFLSSVEQYQTRGSNNHVNFVLESRVQVFF